MQAEFEKVLQQKILSRAGRPFSPRSGKISLRLFLRPLFLSTHIDCCCCATRVAQHALRNVQWHATSVPKVCRKACGVVSRSCAISTRSPSTPMTQPRLRHQARSRPGRRHRRRGGAHQGRHPRRGGAGQGNNHQAAHEPGTATGSDSGSSKRQPPRIERDHPPPARQGKNQPAQARATATASSTATAGTGTGTGSGSGSDHEPGKGDGTRPRYRARSTPHYAKL
jgi:hypothetical protein